MYVCVCVWCLLGLLERKYMYSTVREGNSHLAMNYVFCRGGSRIQFVVCWHVRVESNESENVDFGSNESDRLPRVASIDRGRYMSGRLLDILCSPMSRISDFKSKYISEYCPQIPVSCADVDLWTTGPPPLALPDNDANHEHSALRQSKESENLRFTHTQIHIICTSLQKKNTVAFASISEHVVVAVNTSIVVVLYSFSHCIGRCPVRRRCCQSI